MNRGLVLLGAPGAGTSTVAVLLAPRLGLPLVDTDEVLAADLGQPLAEAWVGLGEEVVRERETAVCLATLERPAAVVALGSGAVADPRVRAALAPHEVCWLQVSTAVATRRLGLTVLGVGPLQAIRVRWDADLERRRHWYEGVATLQVDTDRLQPQAVAEAVVRGVRGGA